jgi:AraC-like DNA-binding protein
MSLTASCDPLDRLVFSVITEGAVEVATAREQVRLGRGDAYLHPVGAVFDLGWNHIDVHFLELPLNRIVEVAVARTGIDPSALRFESMIPVSAATTRLWRATVGMINRELSAPDSALAQPLIQTSTLTMLAAAALATFPNTSMTANPLCPGRVAPAALRRATAFVDSHADQPITLVDIASAAGTSTRALQQAFKRHHNTSPTAYLRRLRLGRAHHELQAADPTRGDTVAAVATRWGFANPGRFAIEYRRAYGHAPSHTLQT